MRTPVDIYALADPRDNTPRYVGASVHAGRRLQKHLSRKSRTDGSRRAAWIRELWDAGLRPRLWLLQTVPRQAADAAETYWILRLGRKYPLTNASLPRRDYLR